MVYALQRVEATSSAEPWALTQPTTLGRMSFSDDTLDPGVSMSHIQLTVSPGSREQEQRLQITGAVVPHASPPDT